MRRGVEVREGVGRGWEGGCGSGGVVGLDDLGRRGGIVVVWW
jgi:hypothetical protein